jgi:hypothetical protein
MICTLVFPLVACAPVQLSETTEDVAERHRYCEDRIESLDGYRCMREVRPTEQAQREATWDFVYRGPQLVRVDHINGRGYLTPGRCSSWRPSWNASVLGRVECRDRNGLVIDNP